MAKGARIVLNSKYFRVAQPGEKPNGKTILSKAAVTNLIEYIATREGVSLNYTFSEEVAPRAATHKQKETIEGLLELIPEGKDTLEYNDYIENPTIKNASELISRVGEMGMEDTLDVDSASNLIEYVAMRPGAVRVGEHGLFSSENSLNLEEAKKEVSEHKGRIWSHVISLRREDADVLGYNTQCPWRNLVISQLDTIAHAHHISVNNLRWYAGMHDTSHHPHIHLEVFSNDETEGYLSSKGIEKMKSAFAHEIFEVELGQVEQEKTKHRDQLKLKFNELFNQIENNPLLQYDEKILQRLAEKLLDLSKELPDKGRKYYKFMPKNIKEKVDNLLEETINNSPALKEMYNTWCEKQVEIEKIYKNEPEQAISILSRPEFKSLKNSILRSAYALRYAENGQRSVESQGDTIRIATSEKDIQSIMDWSLLELQEEAEHHNLNACYQLAKKYQTGDGIKMDLYKAAMWYSIAADNGHSMAAYKLGQIYLSNTNDNIITKNEELGQEYCHKAYLRFYHELQDPRVFEKIENNKLVALDEGIESPYGAYLQCVIGDMYLKGEGVEKDYKKAFSWFELSAANGYINAYYKLGNLYYHGQGTKQDLQQAMNCYRKAKGNPYAEYKLGIMYQRGEGTQQNFERAAAHFVEASSQNNPYAHYKLANLIEDEKLQSVEKDPEVTNILYEKSLDLFKKLNQKNASDVLEYRIGQMYLSGKGTEINLPEAEKWLGLSAAEGNPFAIYQIATLSENGTFQERSVEDLYSLYQTALQGFQNIYGESQNKGQPDSTLSYRIGQMYLSGKGTEINLPEAERWLGLSAAEENPYAQYSLAMLYKTHYFLSNDNPTVYFLFQKSLQNFQASFSESPNGSFAFKIAGFYQYGYGTPVDITLAVNWYKIALDLGNLEAEEALKNIKVAKMEGLFFALSGFAYHTARIFREQMRQTEKQSTDRKIKSAIKKKRIQQGHNPNEQYYE